ncbi:elongator complex protein 2 [Dermatophagoides pteronyssinus]|uniref:Elongator complex protein 2 n=1 Tax=Dermatophagoides pteronyssinus TaxID=6956 RepID=A0A6P6Y0M2_DERPT|nr:elongator complex protein 2-like [Dermatophagoides pteronyssinus]
MDVVSCENVYVSCSVNCYPHCLETKENFIVFGSSNSIVLYDLNARCVISSSSHHSDLINSVRWIDDKGFYIISSSVDQTSIIWQKDERNVYHVKYVLNGGHKDSIIISDSVIVDLEFYSVSTASDKSLCIWQNEHKIFAENLKHFIFDVRIYNNMANISGLIVLTAGSDDCVQINRFNSLNKNLECLITLQGHSDWIKSIDLISFNDKCLLASASQDFFVRVYEIRKSSLKTDMGVMSENFSVTNNNGNEEYYSATLETVLAGHEGWVTNARWIIVENRIHLLTCSSDKMIILWEQMDDSIWNEKYRFGEVGENALGFLSCSFIQSSQMIVGQSQNGAVHLWKKMNDQNCWQSYPSITGHFKEVTDLTWEPDGEYFLSCSSDQTTRLHSSWNSSKITSWHEIARPQIHGYDLKSIAMVGRFRFVSGADEKVVRIFNATKNFIESIKKISLINIDLAGDEIAECAIVPSLGLSNSAVFDISKIEEEFKPKTIEMPPSEEILMQNTLWPESQKLYGHGYEIFAVAVNHANTLLASACKASNATHASIILWDLITFKKLSDLCSHNLTVTQIRFSPDDSLLLSVSRDRTWSLFNVQNSEYRRIAFSDKNTGIHSRIIWDCAWTPDSKNFLTGSRDKTIIRWYLNDKNETEIQSKEKIPFDHPVTSLDVHSKVFHENNHYLVCVGLENGNLSLHTIDISSGEWFKIFNFENHNHTSTVNRVRFSPKLDIDENQFKTIHMSSCGQDRMIKLFKIILKFK